MEIESSQPIDYVPRTPGKQFAKGLGRPKDSVNIHSKQPSSIAKRLKAGGIDWTASLGAAIKTNDKQLLTIWLRLMPYLVVTGGHRRMKRAKGKASKAALAALDELERE